MKMPTTTVHKYAAENFHARFLSSHEGFSPTSLPGLLDKCTTKHEVQTLLQTKSYLGHADANFNIAILDGHKEFVAHEKFQQLLHKKVKT